MRLADTSVVVPLFASWHVGHTVARRAVGADVALPVHVLAEAFSVLTRLPRPFQAAPREVVAFLERQFRVAPVGLEADAYPRLVRRLADAGITGGRVYDALVGETARLAGAVLLTRDLRAMPIYELLGVQTEVVS